MNGIVLVYADISCASAKAEERYEYIYVTFPLNPLSRKGDLLSLRSNVIVLLYVDMSFAFTKAEERYESVYVTFPLNLL